jgi:hypothetical protein
LNLYQCKHVYVSIHVGGFLKKTFLVTKSTKK